FFSSRRRHTRSKRDWSSDVCSSDLFVIRAYGVAELQRMVAAHIALAREAAEWIQAAPDFELVAPRSLALVNFRYHPPGVEDPSRSEERRVGKECRSRWWMYS